MKFKIKLGKSLRIFLIGIIIFFSFSIEAQNPKSNTDYVNQLNRLASESYLTNPQKTQEYAEKALILAKKLDFKKGIADAYYNQSLIYKLKGNYSEELKLLLQSLVAYKNLALPVEIAKTYNSIGTVYHNQADYLNAQKQFDQALNIYEKLQSKSGKAETLKKIGNIYAVQYKYGQSLEY